MEADDFFSTIRAIYREFRTPELLNDELRKQTVSDRKPTTQRMRAIMTPILTSGMETILFSFGGGSLLGVMAGMAFKRVVFRQLKLQSLSKRKG